LARVNFPNIATIHDFGSEDGVDFLVTEFIPGITLDAKLHVTRLEVPEVLQLGMQLAKGLAAAHQHGIVHRDLKPSNLRITPDGRLKILDFGLAQFAFALQGNDLIKTVTLTKSTELTGTLPYMAPEQLKGEAADSRSDLWAAGTVLYEMATGSVPFEGDNPFVVMNARITGDPIAPRKLNREIPKEIEEIILHAMEREPHCRYASAAAMKADLDDPEAVKLTGRHQHLQSVQGWQARWQRSKLIILSALLPVLVFLIAFILFRCHGATH